MSKAREKYNSHAWDIYDVLSECEHLEQQNKTMREGLIWFVKRVRSGEVRSKKTYAKFVELIESATGLSIEEVLLK